MQIKQKIEGWVKEVADISEPTLVHPKEMQNGDYTLIVNSDNAEGIFKKLEENQIAEIEKLQFVAPRFINIYLSKKFFEESVDDILEKKEKYGENNNFLNQKVIIEYTDPNPFKEFHIGHLMPNIIGESVARLFEASNAKVKRANYQGDVGMHVAYAVWSMVRKGGTVNGSIFEKAKYLGECYAHGATSLKEHEYFRSEMQEINKKIFDKSDPEINKLYEWGRKVSLEYFEIWYEKLGTKFDFYFFESEVSDYAKEVVLEFLKKGVFEESEGAIIFRGEKYDPRLHTRVFVNSQGLPVYEAKELGLSKIKYDKYAYDRSIIITGNEINEYFKVLLAAMREVFPELSTKTEHISHGMLRLPTGKMSSRTGEVITFGALLEHLKLLIKEKIKDRGFDEKEADEISDIVAIGAIKYSILRQSTGGDIVFDFDSSLSFEGDSGPYLQYTCVRAKSVLEKAEKNDSKNVFSKKSSGLIALLGQTFFSKSFLNRFNARRPDEMEITNLERYLYRFPEVVERCADEYEPHYLVTYLTELASTFNAFYAQGKIIDEGDPTSPYKIALTHATATVLESGLKLLGIKVPKKM